MSQSFTPDERRRYAIGRTTTRRRAARLRHADRILADVVAVGHPDWRREREREFVDAYARRLLLALDGNLTAGRLTAIAADALRDAGWRCALRDPRSRQTRRKARAMIRDPRTHDALREKFTEAGLTGELIAGRLKAIIEDDDAENSLKAIDIAIKVTGDYAPTRVDNRNLNVNAPAGNIFAGGGAFMHGVGKPLVDEDLQVLPPAQPTSPIEQELAHHGNTSALDQPGREHRRHDPFEQHGDERTRRHRHLDGNDPLQ